MDGWGHGQHPSSDAIYQARTPFVKSLYQKYPHCELTTHGEAVGLPAHQMGNSEVGHMNIGAGRIVYQELLRIDNAIRDGELQSNKKLLEALRFAREEKKPVHLIGLVSEGGVHSSMNHLKAVCDVAVKEGNEKVFIHAFTDGRDTDPKSGAAYLSDLQYHIRNSPVKIASVVGRYFAMDRDKRWERIKIAYDLLTKGEGKKTNKLISAIEDSYAAGITDEFIKPIVCADENGNPVATIRDGDVVICFNFRTDRCRQITRALTQEDFPDQQMKKLNLRYLTMTIYDHSFSGVENLFDNQDLSNTLGEVLEQNGKKQIRISETEKYPHVTFFFSGGREKEFEGEKRIMIPSPKVATYDLQPEMSAPQVKDAIVAEIKKQEADFICLNFANPDMVGHTGVFSAIIRAVETIDQCANEVVTAALANNYTVLLTADHGNADYAINPDGSPNTAHTKNQVPLFLIDQELKTPLHHGKLGDLAPTILHLMGLEIPKQMEGKILLAE